MVPGTDKSEDGFVKVSRSAWITCTCMKELEHLQRTDGVHHVCWWWSIDLEERGHTKHQTRGPTMARAGYLRNSFRIRTIVVSMGGVGIQVEVDQGPSAVSLQGAIQNLSPNEVIPVNGPLGESESNGRAENAIRRVQEKSKALRHQFDYAWPSGFRLFSMLLICNYCFKRCFEISTFCFPFFRLCRGHMRGPTVAVVVALVVVVIVVVVVVVVVSVVAVVVVVAYVLPRSASAKVGNSSSRVCSVAVVGSDDVPQENGGVFRSRSSPGGGSAPACLYRSRVFVSSGVSI